MRGTHPLGLRSGSVSFVHLDTPLAMSKAFPVRDASHQLEELSERFFVGCLPKNWAWDRPANDYGVDLHIDLFEGDLATGLELLVQLKASAKVSEGHSETVRLKTATYSLLWTGCRWQCWSSTLTPRKRRTGSSSATFRLQVRNTNPSLYTSRGKIGLRPSIGHPSLCPWGYR
jgi:Domain of unknown function (DUF4365)